MRDSDPITSHIAADKMVKSGALSRQEWLIFKEVKDIIWPDNNWTASELADETLVVELDYHTIQRRLSGLHNKGKIERLNTEGGTYKEGDELMKRDDCAVWRLL